MFRLSMFVAIVLCSHQLAAQTMHKCSDSNGKVTLQDVPCASGSASTIRVQPASGSDKSGEQAKKAANEIEALRKDVGLMQSQREHREAAHRIGVLTSRLDNFSAYRAETYKARDLYVQCSPGSRVLCLDLANRATIDRDLDVEFKSMLSARSTAEAEKRKSNRDHYDLTKKWLD